MIKNSTQDDKKSTTSVNIIKTIEDMTDTEFNDFMMLSLEKAENVESVMVYKAFKDCI